MKGRTATMDKWGYVCQRLYRDIVEFEITDGYAYNSGFDENVFEFNCEWFKTINPLDNIQVHDIRGYVMEKIAFTEAYKNFCEEQTLYTESGNYSTTAETVFRYLTDNIEFIEEHTALADSDIELSILINCIDRGGQWDTDYKVYRSITKNSLKEFEIITAEGETLKFPYTSKRKIGENGLKFSIKQRV
jgi:hypothetical protein